MKIPSPAECGLPDKFGSWRSGQEEALSVIITNQKRVTGLQMPTGKGKSPVCVAAALLSKVPTCVVTNSRGLQDQYLKDFKDIGMVDIRGKRNYPCDMRSDYTCEEGHAARCPYKGTVGCPASSAEMRAATSSLVVTNYAKWTSARKYGMGMQHFQQVIFDEGHCFPGSVMITLADGSSTKRIDEVKVGDLVQCVSGGRLTASPVTTSFVRKTTELRRIVFEGGHELFCTGNHEILTNLGWVRAANLTSSMLCLKHVRSFKGSDIHSMLHLQSYSPSGLKFPYIQLPEVSEGILQQIMCGGMSGQTNKQIGICPQDGIRENETEQSHVRCPDSGENGPDSPGKSYRAYYPRGEREHEHSTDSPMHRSRVGSGSDYPCPESKEWTTEELQSGHRQSNSENSSRSGREESPCPVSEGAGSEERRVFDWVRVESVEVLQSGGSKEFEEVCRYNNVYDLEVEGSHNYIADGILVHNSTYDALAGSMQVLLNHREINKDLGIDFLSGAEAAEFPNWKPWASAARAIAEREMIQAQARITGVAEPKPSHVRQFTHMRNLVRRLATISTANAKEWIVDEVEEGFQFDPIRPGRYAESALLLRVPKIIIVSATLRPKSLFMIGIGKDNFHFQEFNSDFDPKRCPIYYIPTMRVDKNHTDLRMLWATHDRIAAKRRDRNGIVHTISYARRDDILSASRFADSMIINQKGEPPAAMIEQFIGQYPGAILVSPSVGTGYDFAGKAAEWQFICKIPFPDSRSKIIQARQHDDPEYGPYAAMQDIVQMAGRPMRSKEDRAETFIADQHLDWFLPRYGHLAPKSFHNFFRRTDTVPPPPERLR